MRIARVKSRSGHAAAALVEGDKARLTAFSCPLDLVRALDPLYIGVELSWQGLMMGLDSEYKLLAPVDPPEVWALGFTYQRGERFTRSPILPRGPAYSAAIASNRPEVFFKTTGLRVVGPNASIGIRGDSHYTAVEPELCVIIDEDMRPILLTIGNDVSAWDIEACNPLWLAQSKTYAACCALGPLAVTLDELPKDAKVYCRVKRGAEELFNGSVALAEMRWSYEKLIHFVAAFNPLPRGSVLMTGTGIIRPGTEGLAEGDVVEIDIDGIGTLINAGELLASPVPYMPYD